MNLAHNGPVTPELAPLTLAEVRALTAILDAVETPEEFDAFLCTYMGETPESIKAKEEAFGALAGPEPGQAEIQ